MRLQAVRHLEPPPKIRSADWLQENVTMPAGTETGGMPFSLAAFPHADGPLDAFDDPSCRKIVLQWGTRLGKTTLCLSLMAKVAGVTPRNMMFASSTKDSAGRVVGSRLYPILESTEGVRKQLLPEHRRSRLDVRLEACRIFVGWSGSETSLADVGAFFGVANEIDKWDQDISTEADSLALFVNRFKGFPLHKIIFESTPTIRGRSRVERLLLQSRKHSRQCPCPHCGHYQVFRKGDGESPGGFRWEKGRDGHSDADLAFATAYYECEACRGKIENHHRVNSLRRGVWCPDGCTVSQNGDLIGTPLVASREMMGFGPLPSWYSLTETWGHFARAWIHAQRRPRDLQDVVNSYLAETWEVRKTKTEPEKLGTRIGGDFARGVVPEGGLFLTVTVDQQQGDGGYVVFVVMAHGADDRAWVVDYGLRNSLDELWLPIMRGVFPCDDRGEPMTPVAAMIDSGWNTKKTYEFCNAHPGVLPCKGASHDLGGLPFRLVTLKDGTQGDGQQLLHVGTDYWETDLQNRLDERLANEAGSLTLCREAAKDPELLIQLCNATLADTVDSRGNPKLLWKKKEESTANDYRDCIRYGLCLGRAWIEQNEGQLPRRGQQNATTNPIAYGGDTRPDGRPWT